MIKLPRIGNKPTQRELEGGVKVRDVLDSSGNKVGVSILGRGMKKPLIVEDEPEEVERIAKALIENPNAFSLKSGENKG